MSPPTQIGERFWTFYQDGVYPCTCFFCKGGIETGQMRWHSRLPVSVYACNACFEGNRVLPGLYPETHQRQIGRSEEQYKAINDVAPTPSVVEKAPEVPENERSASEACNTIPASFIAATARETRISKAHEENMESARQTRSMISCLVSAIVDLTRQLEAMNE